MANLPRYFLRSKQAWKPVQQTVAWKDRMPPCKLCGWAPHMAIHLFPDATPEPRGPFGAHTWMAQGGGK